MSNRNYPYQSTNCPEGPFSGGLPQEQINNEIPLPSEPINGTDFIENRFENNYPIQPQEEDTEEAKKKIQQELEIKKKEQELAKKKVEQEIERKKIEKERKKMEKEIEKEKLNIKLEKEKIEKEKKRIKNKKDNNNNNDVSISKFQIEPLIEKEEELNWKTIRNIAAFRGVIFIILSLSVSFSNYGLISISYTAGHVLLGISLSLLLIVTTVFNSMTEKIEDSFFLRFLFFILILSGVFLLLLSFEYYKTASGSIFFFLFVAMACSALGMSDVLTIIFTTIRKEHLYSEGGIGLSCLFEAILCGVQFILSMIFTGNWWFLLLYFIVLVFTVYFVYFLYLVDKSEKNIYNYPIYGVTKSFSHLFGGIFFVPLNILSIPLFVVFFIPMKMCSYELSYNDFRKKLTGGYAFSEL